MAIMVKKFLEGTFFYSLIFLFSTIDFDLKMLFWLYSFYLLELLKNIEATIILYDCLEMRLITCAFLPLQYLRLLWNFTQIIGLPTFKSTSQ
jgi:hypothetical protein